jgi:hypothetical protein
VETGLMTETDVRVALEHTGRLYKELYQEYDSSFPEEFLAKRPYAATDKGILCA